MQGLLISYETHPSTGRATFYKVHSIARIENGEYAEGYPVPKDFGRTHSIRQIGVFPDGNKAEIFWQPVSYMPVTGNRPVKEAEVDGSTFFAINRYANNGLGYKEIASLMKRRKKFRESLLEVFEKHGVIIPERIRRCG